ncbi:MAG: hypothetical protein R6X13_00215 [bacterium]
MTSRGQGSSTVAWAVTAVVAVAMLLPTVAGALTIQITIHGKGGLQIAPPRICPQSDPAVCMELTIDSEDPYTMYGADENGTNYIVYLSEPIPPNLSAMQGSDLKIDHIDASE